MHFFPFEIAFKTVHLNVCRKSVWWYSWVFDSVWTIRTGYLFLFCFFFFFRFVGVAYHCRYKPFVLTFIHFYCFQFIAPEPHVYCVECFVTRS